MQSGALKKLLIGIFMLVCTLGYGGVSMAHEAQATMDPDGNVAGFTGYALVTCFDDGNGPTDHFAVSIKDLSPPQDNLFVSVQVIGGVSAASATDPVSGDNGSSPEIRVRNGNNPYLILVNKTGEGPRTFLLTYHCQTASGIHTGTSDPLVRQFK